MKNIILIMVVMAGAYLLLATGLAAVYFRWLPGFDGWLDGRDIHSYGYYLARMSWRYASLAGIVFVVVVAFFGCRAWVRATGGWRRFLPRFAFLLLMTAAMLEGVLRWVFSRNETLWPAIQNPDVLADAFTDDAYWVLAARLAGGVERDYVVPIRGWSQTKPSPENPHGLRQEAREALAAEGPWIYFYGDSFVQGMPFNELSLPRLLTERLKTPVAVNLGVRGYGVDQMYLKCRELGLPPAGSEVWVGILTWDLDRAYLTYMYGQKPRFQIRDGNLELVIAPGEISDQEFVDSFSMPFRSWLVQAIRRNFQKRDGLERRGPERDEKIALNRAVLAEWSAWCREESIPLRVVLFHTRQDLAETSWRTDAVKNICHELGLPLYDTADALMPHVKATDRHGADLYQEGDFHHTDLANRLIADGLAVWAGKTMGDGQ